MNIKQIILTINDIYIFYLSIKGDNNFLTWANDKNIKIWKKNNKDKFSLNSIIRSAQNNFIFICSNDINNFLFKR